MSINASWQLLRRRSYVFTCRGGWVVYIWAALTGGSLMTAGLHLEGLQLLRDSASWWHHQVSSMFMCKQQDRYVYLSYKQCWWIRLWHLFWWTKEKSDFIQVCPHVKQVELVTTERFTCRPSCDQHLLYPHTVTCPSAHLQLTWSLINNFIIIIIIYHLTW